MLAAGAAERHHQTLEAPPLVVFHAGVHQRHHAGEELVNVLLLIKVIDHRGILAGESLEALFAPGIGQTPAIEDESAAISAVILGYLPVKRETENAHHQAFRFAR